MSRDEFGPRLREERERRGISLEELAIATKVSVELWEGMERNDFSRWPAGIFARAFVRDYARAIGLDADAVVNDFCRYFPIGDRRAARIVRGQAELIGHRHEARETELLPAGKERRRPTPAPPSSTLAVYGPRIAAATFDVLCVSGIALTASTLLRSGVLASVGVASILYFACSTIAVGTSPGLRILAELRLRVPARFTSRRTVNA